MRFLAHAALASNYGAMTAETQRLGGSKTVAPFALNACTVRLGRCRCEHYLKIKYEMYHHGGSGAFFDYPASPLWRGPNGPTSIQPYHFICRRYQCKRRFQSRSQERTLGEPELSAAADDAASYKNHPLVQWVREQGGTTAAGVAIQSSNTHGYGLFTHQVFYLTFLPFGQIPVNMEETCTESVSVALLCLDALSFRLQPDIGPFYSWNPNKWAGKDDLSFTG